MSQFLVTTDGTPGWQYPSHAVIAAVDVAWPDAEVLARSGARGSVRAVVWSLPSDGGPLEVSVNDDGNALMLEGPLRPAVEFALWWAKLVACGDGLVFCDEDGSREIAFKPTATVDALIDAYEAP